MTAFSVAPSVVDGSMVFPGCLGRGLRIAVIDSGVNAGHAHICTLATNVAFGSDGEAPGEDRLGHGTAVMAAIQEKAPGAEYFALQIFSDSLRATTPRLMEAIDWTIRNRIDLVNLSLGTPKLEFQADFETLVKRAQAAGLLLVSAWRAGEQRMLPGCLSGVVGVDVDWNLDRHQFRVTPGAPLLASGYPRPLPGRHVTRNLYGISFAVANATGILARALELCPDRSLPRLYEVLLNEARRLGFDALL
jgi:Subtilase family